MKTLLTTLFALALSGVAFAGGGDNLKANPNTFGPAVFSEARLLLAEEHFNEARDMIEDEEPAPARTEEATAVEPGIGVDDDYTLRLREGRDAERSVDEKECFLGVSMIEC